MALLVAGVIVSCLIFESVSGKITGCLAVFCALCVAPQAYTAYVIGKQNDYFQKRKIDLLQALSDVNKVTLTPKKLEAALSTHQGYITLAKVHDTRVDQELENLKAPVKL